MDYMLQLGSYLLQFFSSILLLVLVVRLMSQLAQVDYYNPLNQAIVKITNPLVLPLRRIVPAIRSFDLSTFVVAYGVQFLTIFLLCIMMSRGFVATYALVWTLLALAMLALNIYFFAFIIVIIASWIAPHNSNPALLMLSQITEPLVRPIRNIMPDLGGIDISPIFVFLAIGLLKNFLIMPLMIASHFPRGLLFTV